MILWTIQPVVIWDLLNKQGYYHGTKEHTFRYELLQEGYVWALDSYDWIKQQLANKTGVNHDFYPVWAWYKRPDLRQSGHAQKGERHVLIELEIDEREVLLSDFELWHYVLNYWHIPDSMEEGDIFDGELESKGLSYYQQKPLPEPYHTKIKNSWQKIFNLDWYAKDIADKREGKVIQAVFWELRLEQVRKIKEFIAK